MMVNKTPSSFCSRYFGDLSGSGEIFMPVRIKVTPNSSLRPMSDSKKYDNLPKPVLIKELLRSMQKNKSPARTSVSTQKKKNPLRSNQPYLNTQSCYKPKKYADESTLFGIKSSGGNRVRRQLYQTLDSPKLDIESKENTNKIIKTKKIPFKTPLDETNSKNTQTDKTRKSLLLPPNTIKNSFLRKSEFNVKTQVRTHTLKNNSSIVNKNAKTVTQKNETKKQSYKSQQNNEMNFAGHKSLSDSTDCKAQTLTRSNWSTSIMNKKIPKNKISTNLDTFERPTVIISPSKSKSSQYLNSMDNLCLEMQKLNSNEAQCTCGKETYDHSKTQQSAEHDFAKLNNLENSGLLQLRDFLVQSVEACENQLLWLKKSIDFINQVLSESSKIEAAKETNTLLNNSIKESTKSTKNLNSSSITFNSNENLNQPTINTSCNAKNDDILDKMNISISEQNLSTLNKSKKNLEDINSEHEFLLPRRMSDIHQESSEASLDNINEGTRLSTIGEVSCEFSSEANESKKYEKRHSADSNQSYLFENGKDVDENCLIGKETGGIDKSLLKEDENNTEKINLTQDESEDKENNEDYANKMIHTPRQLKTRRRSVTITEICSSHKRRSARLAAKSMTQLSLCNSENHDSFTLLENELNLVHNPPPSKSAPTSPSKLPPLTPATMKRVERPLREYMAMKINGSFLVTPDVKRFQSSLEPTDTPHSRKSLSRKIFMELCDLYGESPEHK